MIIPEAEPFYFPGNLVGCLLVHGLTGTPKEMRWFGEYLGGQGYSVLAIRLAGHATKVDDLQRMQWQDWLASVEDGYDLLKGCADRVFLIGLSLGGILALLFAARHGVTGVVSMSAPYDLPNYPRLKFIRILAPFITKVNKGMSDWQNPEAAKDNIEYPHNPTRAVIQLRNLLAEMRLALPAVKAPALIIHSRKDSSVPASDAEKIYSAIGSQDRQLVWVENSGHNIPREPDRQLVFLKTHEFIQRVIPNSQPLWAVT